MTEPTDRGLPPDEMKRAYMRAPPPPKDTSSVLAAPPPRWARRLGGFLIGVSIGFGLYAWLGVPAVACHRAGGLPVVAMFHIGCAQPFKAGQLAPTLDVQLVKEAR